MFSVTISSTLQNAMSTRLKKHWLLLYTVVSTLVFPNNSHHFLQPRYLFVPIMVFSKFDFGSPSERIPLKALAYFALKDREFCVCMCGCGWGFSSLFPPPFQKESILMKPVEITGSQKAHTKGGKQKMNDFRATENKVLTTYQGLTGVLFVHVSSPFQPKTSYFMGLEKLYARL